MTDTQTDNEKLARLMGAIPCDGGLLEGFAPHAADGSRP